MSGESGRHTFELVSKLDELESLFSAAREEAQARAQRTLELEDQLKQVM